MKPVGPFIRRLWGSAVVWSWAFNGLRLASSILLLPILSVVLTEADFGFYWILVSFVALMPLLDLGFGTAVGRSIGYAVGGASEIREQGVDSAENVGREPNYPLLWQLLFTTRIAYRLLALGTFVILGAWGTYWTGRHVGQSSDALHTWIAWGLTLAGGVFEMYAGWWNVYLRGLNQVLICSRIYVLAFALRLCLASLLLLAGAGLLSVPIGTLLSSLVQRVLSRRYVLRILSSHPPPVVDRAEVIALFRTMWPNSWRVGLHCLSYCLVPHGTTVICLNALGLAANAQYGLSLQIMTILYGMTSVWVAVKWPQIAQQLVRREIGSLRQTLRIRMLLQLGSFVLMAAVAIAVIPAALNWFQTGKNVIPQPWLTLMAVTAFLDLHSNTWVTFISVGNRLPFIWYTILTNAASVVLAYVLISTTSLGFGALVLAPLVANLTCNFWRWPIEGARMLETNWRSFMFFRRS
jgi:O-antigen/teichoic acid export membrane protein